MERQGRRRGFGKLWLLLAAMVALVFVAAACGDDGDDGGDEEEARQEVEALLAQLVATGPDDIDFFLDHVTDQVLEDFFGFTREECRENAEECVGEAGTLESIENLEITDDTASADVNADFGSFAVELIREDDTWKVDQIEFLQQEIPEGATVVDLTLTEFAFAFDETAIPADGNLAFQAQNEGGEQHEVVLVKVPEDLDIEQAVMSEEEPEGVEDVGFAGRFEPGEGGTVVPFEGPLGPGRYVLLCFVEDAQGTPHAQRGMWAEFTIPEAGGE